MSELTFTAKQAVEQSPELQKLLREITDWMLDNDYECGVQGCQIYNEIENILPDE